MTWFNVAAGLAGLLGLGLAIWQYVENRMDKAKSRERLEAQARRAADAVRLATIGAQHSNMIVQRAKDPRVSVVELQSLARLTRGTLLTLASGLEEQEQLLKAMAFGSEMTNSVNVPAEATRSDRPGREVIAGGGGTAASPGATDQR